jgi:Aspartyl protease
VNEMTIRYKTFNNLIILPVRINDSIRVNLILDTGCRNMILFGKRFNNLFRKQGKPIEFSGLGSGKRVTGDLSLDNQVTFGAIAGNGIPIILVQERNMFSTDKHVDGIIGYEIFIKFEIEIDFREQLITFRPAATCLQATNFQYVPMKVVDSRPVIEGTIFDGSQTTSIPSLLIDTGSSLGLIIGTTDRGQNSKVVGKGLNGVVHGTNEVIQKLQMADFEIKNVSTSYIVDHGHYASIGMDILRHYRVILNYPKAYVGFSQTQS